MHETERRLDFANFGKKFLKVEKTSENKNQVDVVVTCFNEEATIADALESVVRQQGDAIAEVFVIDNGSQDNSWDIINSFCEGRDNFHCLIQNKPGLPAARNLGVSRGGSPYVAFLDGDDRWQPDKIHRQITFMTKHRSSFSFTDVFLDNTSPQSVFACRDIPGAAAERTEFLLKFSPAIFPSTVMISRDLFTKISGFDEAFLKGQDTLLYLYASTLAELHRLPEALTVRKLSRESLGSDYTKKREFLFRAISKFLKDHPEFSMLRSDAHYAVDMHYLQRALENPRAYPALEIARTTLRHLGRRSMYLRLGKIIFSKLKS